MAIHIRDPRADRLVRDLARECGTTLTEAIVQAAEEKLARVRKRPSLVERLKPLQESIARRPDTGVTIDKAFFDSLNDEDED